MIYLVAGSITSGSWKQKINGGGGNELTQVNNMMRPVLWILYFIQAQGYTMDNIIIFQDNHSTMHLMLNSKESSFNNTKHINVRYFFVKDVINRGEMLVEYCRTK